jgi:hypothetical protein
MTDGLALESAFAAAIAERRVTVPAPGLKMSAVLLTLTINIGAMFGLGGLEDTFWVYVRNAQAKTASIESDKATFLFIVK